MVGTCRLTRGGIQSSSSEILVTQTLETCSVKIRQRVSLRCRSRFILLAKEAYALLSDAVGARRGDCRRVELVAFPVDATPASQSSSTTVTASRQKPQKRQRRTIQTIYNVPDYGGEPTQRFLLAQPVSQSGSRWARWLKEGEHNAYKGEKGGVELAFYGGGDVFLVLSVASVEERNKLIEDKVKGEERMEGMVCVTVGNVERIDTIERVIVGDSVDQEFAGADAGAMIRIEDEAAWIVRLWRDILRKGSMDDRDGITQRNVFHDLTAQRFSKQ